MKYVPDLIKDSQNMRESVNRNYDDISRVLSNLSNDNISKDAEIDVLKINQSGLYSKTISFVEKLLNGFKSTVTYFTMDDLRDAPIKKYLIAEILGYYQIADGGGGSRYYWDDSSTEFDDGISVIKSNKSDIGRYKIVYDGTPINVLRCGFKPDGISENDTKIDNIKKYAQSIGTIVFPKGAYFINRNNKFDSINVIMEPGAYFTSSLSVTLYFDSYFYKGLDSAFLGNVTPSFSSTSVAFVNPKWFGAKGDNSNNDTSAMQKALNNFKVIFIPYGSYKIDEVTVPTTFEKIICDGTLYYNSNNTTIIEFLADENRNHTKYVDGLKVNGTGGTGITGVQIGDTTAVLYFHASNWMIIGTDTAVKSMVSMEHFYYGCIFRNSTCGFKLYSDSTNGGGNSNIWVSCRFQDCTVGCFIRSYNISFPMQNNLFLGCLFQGCTVNGIATYYADATCLDNIHFESIGSGASSASIDSYTIYKSAMYLDHSTLTLRTTDNAEASLSGYFKLVNTSKLRMENCTGYGVPEGLQVSCDENSYMIQSGLCNAIGTMQNIQEYGALSSIGTSFSCHGAPVITFANVKNEFNSDGPVNPNFTTLYGSSTEQVEYTDHGQSTSIIFAPTISVGETYNGVYMPFNVNTSGAYAICSFYAKSSVASKSYWVKWTATVSGGSIDIVEEFIVGTTWKRFVYIVSAPTSSTIGMNLWPASTGANTMYFRECMSYCGTLQEVSDIYRRGVVGVIDGINHDYAAAAPTYIGVAGTSTAWPKGKIILNNDPDSAEYIGWVCVTTSVPGTDAGTWKTYGLIS